jgi:hypothetical protein
VEPGAALDAMEKIKSRVASRNRTRLFGPLIVINVPRQQSLVCITFVLIETNCISYEAGSDF